MTDRQTAVLELVSAGLENKEIGHRLGISEQAVKEHVSNLLRLLSAPNRAALADAAATFRVLGTMDVGSDWLGLVFLRAPMNAALYEGPEHRFIAVNDAYRRAAGQRDLVGKTFREAFPERDEAGIVSLLDQAYRMGEPVSMANVPARWYRRNDGAVTIGYLTNLIQPMRRADGTVAGVAQFSIDVTDEVEARSVARELADEQVAILDQLPCGVVAIDRDGDIVKLNDAGRRIVPFDDRPGTRPSEVLELRDLKTGATLPDDSRPLARALRGERSAETDYLGVIRSTGEKLILRISAVPLFDAKGAVRGAIAVFTRVPGD